MLLLLSLKTSNSFAQTILNENLTPDGVLDNVFDKNGNKYKLQDLLIIPNNTGTVTTLLRTAGLGCNSTSYFDLFFEIGSGMEPVPGNAAQTLLNAKRREVICKVVQDISAFIPSPLTANGNQVNIIIRNINNVPGAAAAAGVASSFYNVPENLNNGGITDGEIWKTIHTGVDSYANVAAPLNNSQVATNGVFYHGYMAFNFSNLFNWNITTSISNPANTYDLYSVALHEMMHALGLISLIRQDGTSTFDSPKFKYFSRYDTFLKSNNTSLLVNGILAVPLYNNKFNSTISNSVLTPGCQLPLNINTGGTTDSSDCNFALKFVSPSVTIPIYTPTCFERGSSYSHFEDTCFPSTPSGNNNYFAMCNAGPTGITRRYLKPEERQALCDIGYRVNSTYGVSGALINGAATSFNYGGTQCSGITVSGVNDGVDAQGNYIFNGNAGTNITISGAMILSNDIGVIGTNSGFRRLQDLTTNTTLAATGNSTSVITLNSTLPGIHLLRYIPYNGTQFGNITYVYVLVREAIITCPAMPNTCDLVINGNFEQYLPAPNSDSKDVVSLNCGWANASGTCDRFINSPLHLSNYQVPCNLTGYQNDAVAGNNSYIGFRNGLLGGGGFFHEIVKTRLRTPLIQGVTYQLSFDVSLSESTSFYPINMQAFVSPNDLSFMETVDLPITTGVFLPNATSNPTFSIPTNSFNNWTTVTFTFTSAGNEQFLYLGGLRNVVYSTNTIGANSVTGCFTAIATVPPQGGSYSSYNYLDNVSMIPLNGSFNLPATLACPSANIPNLMLLISGAPTNGVFTGQGVQLVGGIYSFNPLLAGAGVKTIIYTYFDGTCTVKLIKNITVTTAGVTPIFSIVPFICTGASSPLPTTSANSITGTWSPAFSNTQARTYMFTPTGAMCPTNTVNIAINQPSALTANNDSYTVNYPTGSIVIPSTILVNDTLNGAPISSINNAGLMVTQVNGLNPPFPSGGISIDNFGKVTVAANTPAGTYLIYYTLNKTCSQTSNQGVVTITINQFFNVCPKMVLADFCYNANAAQTSTYATNSIFTIGGFVNTQCSGVPTAGGVPATPANTTVITTSATPPGVVLNSNGTVTVPAGFYTSIEIFYKLCSGSICTGNMENKVYVMANKMLLPWDDDLVFDTSGNPSAYNYSNNVLTNDKRLNCSNGTRSQITIANVTLSVAVPNPYFTISNTGVVSAVNSSFTAPGNYQLTYKVTDITNPSIWETAIVKIRVNLPRLSNQNQTEDSKINFAERLNVSPNPSDGYFTVNFANDLKEKLNFTIFNLIGQKISEQESYDSNEVLLNLSDCPTGTYFLKITSSNDIITKKLIKN